MKEVFYSPADPAHLKKQKIKGRELRQTQWWKQKLSAGRCHYCDGIFKPDLLTMDHVIPIGRGGHSSKGNVVVACKECNSKKGHRTDAEQALSML